MGRDATVLEPLYPTLTGDLATDLRLVWAAWMAAGPALRAAGQLPARAEGSVAQLNLSDGGLPKTPVERVEVEHVERRMGPGHRAWPGSTTV